jgi:ATP-dependent DNA helicase RecG
MDDRALELLLRDLEAPSSERKASFADRDRVCQAICAFANDMISSRQPGYIFIGANDDGSPSGTPITDDLLLKLTALRSDGRILPQPRMVVEKRTLLGPPWRSSISGPTWVR